MSYPSCTLVPGLVIGIHNLERLNDYLVFRKAHKQMKQQIASSFTSELSHYFQFSKTAGL